MPPTPKTAFLHIRLSREDKERVKQAAEGNYLDASTWARMTIMKAVEEYEQARGLGAENESPASGA